MYEWTFGSYGAGARKYKEVGGVQNAILAADIGGTSMRFALVKPETREILKRYDIPTDGRDYEGAMYLIGMAAGELLAKNSTQITALGIGVPGVMDGGTLTASGNLPGWNGKNVGHDIRKAFDLNTTTPTAVLNDCAAAALGEYTHLYKPFLYVIWGTGIGAAVVTLRGVKPVVRPTEAGHMIIDRGSHVKCGCGGYGHWEALASGGNVDGKRFRKGRFGKQCRRIHELTEEQWDEVLRDMAVGLRNLSSAHMGLDIVIGGGVMCKQQHRLGQLQSLVLNLPSPAPAPVLSVAWYREDSGLYGAAEAASRVLRRL